MGEQNKLRDLGSSDVQKQSDEEISDIISKGRNRMPSYGKSLKPEQIKDLVAHIRTMARTRQTKHATRAMQTTRCSERSR